MPIVPVIPKDNVRLNQLIKACSGYVTLDDVALWVPSEPNEEFDGWLDRAEPKLQKLAAEFVGQVQCCQNRKRPWAIEKSSGRAHRSIGADSRSTNT